jgi:hypothetical protein
MPSLEDQNSLHLMAEGCEMYRQAYKESGSCSEGRSP